jgi:hypothetical protein
VISRTRARLVKAIAWLIKETDRFTDLDGQLAGGRYLGTEIVGGSVGGGRSVRGGGGEVYGSEVEWIRHS